MRDSSGRFGKMFRNPLPDRKESNQLLIIARHAAFGICGRVFFLFVRFLTTLIITRSLGPGSYGIYVLAMGISGFAGMLSLLGLDSAMVKFVAHHMAQNDDRMVRGTVTFGLKWSAMASVILGVALFLYSDAVSREIFSNSDLGPVLRIVAVGIPLASFLEVLLAALQGAKYLQYNIAIQHVLLPLCRFLAVSVILALGFGLTGVAWTWSLTPVVGIAISWVYISTKLGFSLEDSFRLNKREIFSFSSPLLFSQLLYRNITGFEVMVIGIFLPAEQLGLYGVAMRVVPFLLIPLVSLNAIFSPIISDLISKREKNELEDTFKSVAKWIITASLPLFALLALFSREVVTLFGPGFGDSARIIVIVLIGQLVNVCTGSTGIMLVMTGKPMINLCNSAGLFALNAAMTLLLVPPFGLIGAAAAYTVSMVLIQLLQIAEIWYFYRIHPYRLDSAKPVLSCILSATLIFVLKTILDPSGFFSVAILSAFFLCSYLMILLLLGLSPDDRLVLGRIRHKFSVQGRQAAQGYDVRR